MSELPKLKAIRRTPEPDLIRLLLKYRIAESKDVWPELSRLWRSASNSNSAVTKRFVQGNIFANVIARLRHMQDEDGRWATAYEVSFTFAEPSYLWPDFYPYLSQRLKAAFELFNQSWIYMGHGWGMIHVPAYEAPLLTPRIGDPRERWSRKREGALTHKVASPMDASGSGGRPMPVRQAADVLAVMKWVHALKYAHLGLADPQTDVNLS